MALFAYQIAIAALVLAGGGTTGPIAKAGTDVRCVWGSDVAMTAAEAIARLDDEISAIRTRRAAASALRHLERVLKDSCFAVARHEIETIGPISDLALNSWWAAGGRQWLQSQVERVAMLLTVEQVIFPPEPAPVSTSAQMGRLAHLLCAPFDGGCGAETVPWLEATRREFDQTEGAATSDYYEGVCEKSALGFPVEQRYAAWWGCIEGWRRRIPTVPLGRFRVPTEGWILIVEEGGGHGSPGERGLDRIVVLNLADGAAFSASGGIPSAKNGQGQGPTIRLGRIPTRRVREIGLAIALAPWVQNQRRLETHEVPSDVTIAWTPVSTAPPYVRTAVSIGPRPMNWKWIDHGSLTAQAAFPMNEVIDVRGVDATRNRVNRLIDAAFVSLKPACVAGPPISAMSSQGRRLRPADIDLLTSIEMERKAFCAGGTHEVDAQDR